MINHLSGITVFFQGVVLGFLVAAPVGPIGILCIRTSILEGRLKGFIAGLGAASADAIYGLIASLGLAASTQFLIDQSQWIRLFGGLFLGYLGVSSVIKDSNLDTSIPNASGSLRTYLSTFVLTLSNPLTIISFTAIFASLGAVERGADIFSASLLVSGVFVGSACWWFLLSWGASHVGTRLRQRTFIWINRVAGIVLLIFALIAIYSALIAIFPI